MDRKPTHPGTVFLEDVMKPLNLTVTDAARMLGVSRKALSEFVNEYSEIIGLQSDKTQFNIISGNPGVELNIKDYSQFKREGKK